MSGLHRFPGGRFCLLAVACCLCLGSTAVAQSKTDAKSILKSSPKVLAVFQDVVAKPSTSTVRIVCDGKDAALGTVVGADGWIITKYSELKGSVLCKLKDGRELAARVVGVHDKCDLAMLKVDASDLKPVEFVDSKSVPVGFWVASPGTGTEPVAIGVVSVGTRNITTRESAPTPSPTSGYLGVSLDLDFAGVKVNQVMADAGAQKAGVKVNDQIVAVDGEATPSADAFMGLLQRRKPDEVVTLKIKRGDQELELKATLGKRPSGGNNRGDFQNSLGSQLSNRRTGFPTILQHDSVLKPADCGGPLVDLDGKVLGINIARAGRTETYAVPGELVQSLLADLKSGKYPPPVVAALPKITAEDAKKLEDAKAALQKAEADKAEVERKLAEAKAALEKLQQELEKKKGQQ